MNKVKLNKNIRIAFCLYVVLFVVLVGYILKLTFIDSKTIANTPNNPRVALTKDDVERGDFYSSDDVILTNRGSENVYLYNEMYAHIIGYNKQGVGVSNLEAWQGLTLGKLSREFIQSVKSFLNDEDLKGNSIKLTVDHDLQSLITQLIQGKTGTIIVSDPTTNKILASTSSPNFNPNNVTSAEVSNSENKQFINRATQGLYAPASTFKMVSTLAFIRNYPDYANYTHVCEGTIERGGEVISCHGNKVHGEVGLKDALTYSCNTFFISLSDVITADELEETAESLYFNNEYTTDFGVIKSVMPDLENDYEFYNALIGQGDVLVSPMHLAVIYSAIANNGTAMQPLIFDEIISYRGDVVQKLMPRKLATLMTVEEANILNDLLDEVAVKGTASSLYSDNYRVIGKTGTAQVEGQSDNGLFVGYAPKDNPTVQVTILYEASGGSSATLSDAKRIFDFMLN
ncbi:MAG: penicillin-binding transpeptidase domain-containing protein [Lachnospirales bacterium]